MPELRVGGRAIDADLVVFDKDGTLMDFHSVWGPRGLAGVAALTEECPAARADLLAALGIDPSNARVDGEGVLASAPLAQIHARCTQVLCGHGVAAARARDLVEQRFAPHLRAPPSAQSVRPIGDVAGLLGRLRDAGLACAVLTTDDRESTLAALALIGIADKVQALVCGDDEVPPKPAGDGIAHIAHGLGVEATRSVMVGDTTVDMRAGRAAGCAGVIGVTSGAGRAPVLARLADAVVESVHALGIGPAERGPILAPRK